MIEDRFGRAAFDASEDASVLAQELQAVLHQRLRDAKNRAGEIDRIVQELQTTGHALSCWDDSGTAAVYSGTRPAPNSKHMMIRFYYPDKYDVEVEVVYGPRPTDRTEAEARTLCPACRVPMEWSGVTVDWHGHGQISGGTIRGTVRLGDRALIEVTVGVRSGRIDVAAKACPACKGVWVPGSSEARIT